MSDELSDDAIKEVQEVIANSSLSAIAYFEVSAKRSDTPPDDNASEDGKLNIVVQQRFDESSFGVRLNAVVVLPIGEATASVAGEYDLHNGHRPSQRALEHFTNEVAVMTVFPYLREAIASVTGRVFGQPLHLPIVERGQIAIDVEDGAE